MATVASSLRLRVCFAILTVSALLIGRAAAIPHAHGGGSDEARHAGLPPHFHLSWLYDSGSGFQCARHGGELRRDPTHGETPRSVTTGETSLESDAVYLVEVGEPPLRVGVAKFAPAQSRSLGHARAEAASPSAGERAAAAPPFEPDLTDLYLAVRRLRI